MPWTGSIVAIRGRTRRPSSRDRCGDAGHLQRRREVAILADRRGADREAVAQLRRGRDRAALGRGDLWLLAPPERPRHRDQPSGPEPGAQRREHRVAGDRERLGQRPPAGLAGCVSQSDPGERRIRANRVGARWGGDPALERGGGGHDLERGAGRLRRGHRKPDQCQHRTVSRSDHRDATELLTERRSGLCHQPRADRGLQRAATHHRRAGDHPGAEQQPFERAAAEPAVVEALQSGRLGIGLAGDRGAERGRVQTCAVRCEDRPTRRRRPDPPRDLLAATQTGKP